MKNILVIETFEREIESVTECNDIDEAIIIANTLLESHMDDIDYIEEFKNKEDIESEWDFASRQSQNAWCNFRGNWDAHIFEPMEVFHED